MLGIIIGAAILGIIIAVMEKEEFPGWGNMVICVLAAGIPNLILNYALGPDLWFVGLAVGAVCGMVAISATCGMTVKRSAIAMGIYVLVQIALGFAFAAMFR